MAQKPKAVTKPNWGLYLNTEPITVPLRAVALGENFRITQGTLNNLNLGWTRLGAFTLNGPVLHMDFFFIGGVTERNVWFTDTDMYSYNPATEAVVYITPVEVAGTAAASGTTVTGTSTFWATNDANGVKRAKAGDEISFGSATQNATSATWFTVASVTNGTTIVLTATAGSVSDGAYTLRRRFTGSVGNRWETDFFSRAGGTTDYFYATNGVDYIVKWDGSTTFAVFSDTTFKARVLRVYKNMMIYGGLTQSGTFKPTDILNSNVGDPEDLTALSSQFTVYKGSNPINAMLEMGDNLVIYSRRNITLAQFVGDPFIFIFRQSISDVGTIAGGMIADLGDFHTYLAPDGQYFFDGVTIRSSAKQVWDEVLRIRDPARRDVGWHHFNEEFGELYWTIPLTTDANSETVTSPPAVAFVEHYQEEVGDNVENAHSKRDMPFMSSGYTERQGALTFDTLSDGWDELNYRFNDQFFFAAYPLSIVGDASGQVWILNTSQFKEGNSALPLVSFVRTGRRALGDARMRGMLKRVYPFSQQFGNNMEVTIRLYDNASGNLRDSQVFQYDQNQTEGDFFVPVYRRGRFYELEFGSSTGLAWVIEGYDTDVIQGGDR